MSLPVPVPVPAWAWRSALVLVSLLPHRTSAQSIDTLAGTGKPDLTLANGKALDINIAQPFGVELSPDGALFICEVGNHRLLRLDLEDGMLSTVSGTGKAAYTGDGGDAAQAALHEPYEVRFDRDGNLYLVDMVGAVVRRVDAGTRRISTIAGTGETGFGGDGGPAVRASLRSPHSIALDGTGSLYIADIGNHRIRRVDLTSGLIETVAGTGEAKLPEDGVVATGKLLRGPRALAIDGGTMWIALREGHSVWKMDLGTRKLTHVAGSGEAGYADGVGREAKFNGPKGIAVGPGGAVFVVDTENHAIRRLDPKTRAVTTVAGSGPKAGGYGGDGGPATSARLNRPHGIAVDAKGVLFIGDSENHRVRRVQLRG